MTLRSIELLRSCLSRLCDEANAPEDAVLLQRFVTSRDRKAFELLIVRHGPMVLGTARRLVRNAHDAEDVFQAVFLSFSRLAKTVRDGRSLPAWFHTTTCRIATKVRKDRDRIATMPLPEPSQDVDPAAQLAWHEVRQALDEELQRLPERLRSPLLLCYLSGLTRDEAAQQLDLSLGTLKRQLQEGRKLLRIRLAKRGITTVGLALTVLTPEALQASVGKSLLESSVQRRFFTRYGCSPGDFDPGCGFGRQHERLCHEIDRRAPHRRGSGCWSLRNRGWRRCRRRRQRTRRRPRLSRRRRSRQRLTRCRQAF